MTEASSATDSLFWETMKGSLTSVLDYISDNEA